MPPGEVQHARDGVNELHSFAGHEAFLPSQVHCREKKIQRSPGLFRKSELDLRTLPVSFVATLCHLQSAHERVSTSIRPYGHPVECASSLTPPSASAATDSCHRVRELHGDLCISSSFQPIRSNLTNYVASPCAARMYRGVTRACDQSATRLRGAASGVCGQQPYPVQRSIIAELIE